MFPNEKVNILFCFIFIFLFCFIFLIFVRILFVIFDLSSKTSNSIKYQNISVLIFTYLTCENNFHSASKMKYCQSYVYIFVKCATWCKIWILKSWPKTERKLFSQIYYNIFVSLLHSFVWIFKTMNINHLILFSSFVQSIDRIIGSIGVAFSNKFHLIKIKKKSFLFYIFRHDFHSFLFNSQKKTYF